MDTALALAGVRGAGARASSESRRRPTMSSGGSSSSASRTRSRSPGRRGAATMAAAPRSRSAGRGSRLSAALARWAGGRPRAALPRLRPLRSSPGASGSASAARPLSRGSISASTPARSSASWARTALVRRPCFVQLRASLPSMRARSWSPELPPASRSARAATALVPDEPTGFDELTLTELVSLVHALWPVDDRAAGRARCSRPHSASATASISSSATLSRGLRRQASAVTAFSLAAPLVLVDEATATLDPEAVVVLSEAVAALAASGCGVLLRDPGSPFRGCCGWRDRDAPSGRDH